MTARRLTIATHGHCFDGLASAVTFTALYRALHAGETVEVKTRGFDYDGRGAGVAEADLDGDDNAILDFRYTKSPRLTWYFDHHATAFRTPGDRAAFEAGAPPNGFYEAEGTSCTRLIAETARARFGVDLPRDDDLVEWADRIDSARFDDVEEVVFRPAPALQLASYVERHGSSDVLTDLSARLLTGPLGALLEDPEIARRVAELRREKLAALDVQREVAGVDGEVVVCDLSARGPLTVEKFGLYALFPRARYTTQLFASEGRAKLSVGFNPWSGRPCDHHIGELLRPLGGGGHRVVGGAAFPSVDAGRAAMAELVRALNAPP
ncbi:MAG: hypothetical protein IT374_10470 [Polyangiaceae bacterium]|nr:hypothetical protein [Polyangiaceae bacterium]